MGAMLLAVVSLTLSIVAAVLEDRQRKAVATAYSNGVRNSTVQAGADNMTRLLFVLVAAQIVAELVGFWSALRRNVSLISLSWWLQVISAGVFGFLIWLCATNIVAMIDFRETLEDAKASDNFIGLADTALSTLWEELGIAIAATVLHIYSAFVAASLEAVLLAGGTGEERRRAQEVKEAHPILPHAPATYLGKSLN